MRFNIPPPSLSSLTANKATFFSVCMSTSETLDVENSLKSKCLTETYKKRTLLGTIKRPTTWNYKFLISSY